MSISIRFNDQSIKKIINECKSWYVFLSIYVFPIFIYYLDKDRDCFTVAQVSSLHRISILTYSYTLGYMHTICI